jgi:polyhydroxyalkanoate synthesis regulator phasin
MPQMAEKAFLAGLGALSLARERVKKVVDDLYRRGETARDEIGELARELEDRGKAEKESLYGSICRKCPEQLRFATKQDIERLEKKLDELREKSN